MNVDVLIVGAGPAGLAAAHALAGGSLTVCLVDQRDRVGGQISRGTPKDSQRGDGTLWQSLANIQRGDDLLPSGIEFLSNTTVLGFADYAGPGSGWDPATGLVSDDPDAEHPNCVWITGPGRGIDEVQARAVLIATGAYDLPVPIAGGELPGVMGIGGLQTLLKEGAFDGRAPRFLVAGSHPLLLLTAESLIRHGHRVEGIVVRPDLRWRQLAKLVPGPQPLARKSPVLAQAVATVLRRQVPLLWNGRLTGVNRQGSSLQVEVEHRSRSRAFKADFVGLGYGFLANTQLARQAGCSVVFDLRAGGWIVQHHEHETSRRGVFVAGEQTGVSGAEAAACEGRAAAMAIAARLDPGSLSRRSRDRARRQAAKWNRMGSFLRELSHQDESWLQEQVVEDSLICRCEGLTAKQVLTNAAGSLSDLRRLKLASRVGMGACQARMCGPLLSSLATDSGFPADGLTPRFPIEPMNLTRRPTDLE
jgi:NADPH-dependent 2,4-dienoyl-CoA reductase/sulfur reductase-like enzyme